MIIAEPEPQSVAWVESSSSLLSVILLKESSELDLRPATLQTNDVSERIELQLLGPNKSAPHTLKAQPVNHSESVATQNIKRILLLSILFFLHWVENNQLLVSLPDRTQ